MGFQLFENISEAAVEETKKSQKPDSFSLQRNCANNPFLAADPSKLQNTKSFQRKVTTGGYNYVPYTGPLPKFVDTTKMKAPAAIQYKFKTLKNISRQAEFNQER